MQAGDPTGLQRRTIPLLLKPCDRPRRIAMLTHADFTVPGRLEGEWQRLLNNLAAQPSAAVGPPPAVAAPFFVPFRRNRDFQGREQDLVRLHDTLTGDMPVGIRPAGLTGMGGIGKTELAVEYCYRSRDAQRYPGGIFWINAAGQDWIGGEQGFAALGRRLDPSTADATAEAGRTLTGHEDWVMSVAITPDGRRALSASDDRTLKLWNISPELNAGLETGEAERTLTGHESGVRSVAITPDGRRALSASSDRTLKLWNISSELDAGLETGKLMASIYLEGGLTCLALAPLRPGRGGEQTTEEIVVVGDAAGNVYCLKVVDPTRTTD